MNWTIIQLFVLVELSLSLAPHEIIIFVISQSDEYNIQLAEKLRADINNQSSIISADKLIQVYLLHETFNNSGYWTFLTILPNLISSNLLKDYTKWVVLCEDRSAINLELLIEKLSLQDHTQIAYFGYPLHDDEATIIHHFAFFEDPQWFSYPLLRSGVIFTTPLIKRLAKRVQEERPTMDFFIDASHELSLFMWQNIKIERLTNREDSLLLSNSTSSHTSNITSSGHNKNFKIVSESQTKRHHYTKENDSSHEYDDDVIDNNETSKSKSLKNDHEKSLLHKSNENTGNWRKLRMIKAPFLCPTKTSGCAIYPNDDITLCKPVRPEEVYFAIKTCGKFHKDRIGIIEATWGQYTVHKRYFSDITDDSIPTISTGVPNTETGHCAKTLSILKLALEDITEINLQYQLKKKSIIKWVFLSDDDTILSVSAICNALGCYNSNEDIYLGERYGYRLHSKDGFNYITGGGGIAFSLPTVRKIVTTCTCPTISSPDDMIIGVCLQRLGVKAIHSSGFHQARPPDYSSILLAIEEPISFHKFWQINPIKVYKKWFKNADDSLNSSNSKSNNNCDINSSCSTNIRKNLHNSNNLDYGELSSSSIKQEHIEL